MMNDNQFEKYKKQYQLLRRFEALIEIVLALNSTIEQVRYVRFKPLFRNYNSCIKEFKSIFPEEYKKLDLEDLPLYDNQTREMFTANRISTLLHQSQAVVGILKGMLPPKLIENPGGITIAVTSQSSSISEAKAFAKIQFTLVLDGLSNTIQASKLNNKSKKELLKELDELKNMSIPDESKIKKFASKFFNKLVEVGEDIAAKVIANFLKSQIGY